MPKEPAVEHHGVTDAYDGTNGEEVADQAGVNFVSDDGTTLTISIPTPPGQPAPAVFVSVDERLLLLTPADPVYVEVPSTSQVETIATDVAETTATDVATTVAQAVVSNLVDGAFDISTGSADLAAGGLGGQTQVLDVAVTPELPSTNLTAMVTKRGAPGLLSGHGVTAVEILDTDTVRVTVESGIGAAAGASVHVFVPWLEPGS